MGVVRACRLSGMRRRYSERDRSKFLTEMHRSGEAVWSVASRLGLSKSAAYRWWSAEQQNGPGSAIQFAPLVRSTTAAGSSLVVEVGSARIRLDAGFDPSLLRRVVVALSTEDDS